MHSLQWMPSAYLLTCGGLMLLGGILAEGPVWRWVVLVDPMACATVLPAVTALLPRDRAAARTSRFGLLGSTVVTARADPSESHGDEPDPDWPHDAVGPAPAIKEIP